MSAMDGASRKIDHKDLDQFLGNGFFLGMGTENILLAWGKKKKLKKPDSTQTNYYINDFYLDEPEPWRVFEHSALVARDELSNMLGDFCQPVELDLRWQRPLEEDFTGVFQQIKTKIQEGQLSKAVPAVFSKAQGAMTKSMRARVIRRLVMEAIKPTPYGYLTPQEGVIGASPEFLFSHDVRDNLLQSMALAGTRSSELEKSSSLINDEKEMFEHELVVKGLKEKLKPWGDRHCSPTYVWDLGSISHLRTDIEVELEKKPDPLQIFSDLIHLLHPTAALGVAPNTSDWRYLKKLDGANIRQWFGSPIGVYDPKGRSQVWVGIRNVQWNENGLMVGSGCGVVGASELQNEWRELTLKQQYIFQLLGL